MGSLAHHTNGGEVRVLNLYAGLGGNRRLWNAKVTAVELNPKIAEVYAALYPDDEVIIGDAHDYLINNYKDYDFIWSSPPCQTHSSFRQNICVRFRGTPPVYPDMKLWQEILFLQYNCETNWVVENVKPYYTPLIEPNQTLDRHLFWSNFAIPRKVFDKVKIRKAQIPDLQEYHAIDLSLYRIPDKRQILRNCVSYEVGKYIFDLL